MNDKNAEQLKKVRNKRRDLDIKAAAAAVAIAAAGFAATPLMGQTMPEKSKDDHSTTVVQNQDMARFESLMKRFQEKSDISQKEYDTDYAHVTEWQNERGTISLAEPHNGQTPNYLVHSLYLATNGANAFHAVMKFYVDDKGAFVDDFTDGKHSIKRLSSEEFNQKMSFFEQMHNLGDNQKGRT